MRPIDADALKEDLLKRGFYPVIVKAAIESLPTLSAGDIMLKEKKSDEKE